VADAPAWKADFPITWAEDHRITRRQFGRSLAGFSCASLAATAVVAAKSGGPAGPFPAVKVAGVDELPVGGAKVFASPAGGEPCLLMRLEPEAFAACSQRCTHLGCPVIYRSAEARLYCPCHEGFFDATDGRVLGGPPRRPLPQIELERRGDEIWAVGVREVREEPMR
jgi:cytochrome b6-f complex iron-sulfur subunit